MNQNQAAAFIAAQTAIFNCRMLGMVADNARRLAYRREPKWGGPDFDRLAQEFEPVLGYNAVHQLYENTYEQGT